MIAVDAMGGDYAPHVVVEGALEAARLGIPIHLFGQYECIASILKAYAPDYMTLPLTITHCSQTIDMAQEATRSVIKNKDSSLVRAMHAVREKKADAFVSAGNSGAILAAAILIVGRTQGVLRPALSSFLPTNQGTVLCLDLGANTDCKVDYLEQFAYMGHVYSRLMRQIATPRIGLLSNGHEPYKGSLVVKQTYMRLEKSTLNFVGNIEARDIFQHYADVIVCDGFAGNIMLKTAQATVHAIGEWAKVEINSSWLYKALFMAGTSALKRLKQKISYETTGGALLLGVQQPVVVAHGSSQASAITNAILFAHKIVQENTVHHFNSTLSAIMPTNHHGARPVQLDVP